MKDTISHITLIVADQNKALDFYVNKLGFELHTDAPFGDFRWLTVCPKGNRDFEIILAPARDDQEKAVVGKQAGSYPMFSLSTSDCKKTYEEMINHGVESIQEPIEKPWGIEAMCKDLYGNIIHINQLL